MLKKEFLKDVCLNVGKKLNKKVELFVGFKPDGYFLPQMHLGTSEILDLNKEVPAALFIEIAVDDIIIYRKSYLPDKNEYIETGEEDLTNEVFYEIFALGIMSELNNRK